ncbi:MAG: hypothetical protein ACPGWR_28720 [Ardenticatenaceae bacterium]
MQELVWKDHLRGETLEGGIDLANQLYWNITVRSNGQTWSVWAGEALILKTDSQEAVDAFLYGLGLAYSVLPGPVFDGLQEEVKRWVE